MDRHSQHILPIFDNPSLCQDTVLRFWAKGRRAVYWHIPEDGYGCTRTWDGFDINPEWYIPTKSGKQTLLIEADTTVMDEALRIGKRKDDDLTISEASQAFRTLTHKVEKMPDDTRPDATCRVLLADPYATVTTGGGVTKKIKDSILSGHKADIFLDASTPLLQILIDWANKTLDEGNKWRATTPLSSTQTTKSTFRSSRTYSPITAI